MLAQKDEELSEVKNLLDQEIARYEEELRKTELQVFSLTKEKKEMDKAFEEQKVELA